MRFHKSLLTSSSSIAVNAALACAVILAVTEPAMAACITTVVADTTISGASTCLDWQGGNITITSDGVVSGTSQAILNSASNLGTIVNSGSIDTANHGISNAGTIEFINNNLGTISSAVSAIYNDGGSIGSISIRGTISGDSYGIDNNGGDIGTITNITRVDGGISGIRNQSGDVGTIINDGHIVGASYGIDIADGSLSVLTSSGIILGDDAGIRAVGTIGTINNNFVIEGGTTGALVEATGSIGAISNGAGGIIAGQTAILIDGLVDTIDNIGSIYSSGAGIDESTIVYNTGSIGLIDNTGGMTSYFGNGIVNAGGTIDAVDNAGSITTSATAIFNNGGIIGSISNSGHISTDSSVILNDGGTIGTISNSGSIVGAYEGISNLDGSIGIINNSGLIDSSSFNGIYNTTAATIGTIINSGIITADAALVNHGEISSAIVNDGSIIGGVYGYESSLEITGGSDSAYGVLTGLGGTIGQITSAGLIFDVSAHQVLNANVTAAAVTNDGTIRINNPITITGAYIQAPSATLVFGVTNSSNYGSLTVSGVTTLTNSTIQLVGTTSRSLANRSYTIVGGGGFTDYTGVTVVASGFDTSITTVDGASYDYLVVTLSGGAVPLPASPSIGVTAEVSSALERVQTIVDGGEMAEFQPILDAISDLTSSSEEAGNAAVRQLAPNQVSPQTVSVGALSQQAINIIGRRQDFLVSNRRDPSVGSPRQVPRRGRSSGSAYQDGSFWMQASGGGASRTEGADGYDQDFYGITFGADTRIGSNFTLGEAVSWMHSSSSGSGDSAGSEVDVNSVQLTTYGTYRQGAAYVEGLINFAFDSYEETRNISFLNATAKGDYNGMQYMGRVEAGWDFPLRWTNEMPVSSARQKTWPERGASRTYVLTPVVGLQLGRNDVDGYTETGAGAANLSVASQSTDSFTTFFGGKASTTFKTSWAKIVPEVKIMWAHDFTDDVVATSASVGGVSFTTHGERISANGARISLGGTLTRDDRLDVGVQYDGDLRSGYQSHSGALKIKWKY